MGHPPIPNISRTFLNIFRTFCRNHRPGESWGRGHPQFRTFSEHFPHISGWNRPECNSPRTQLGKLGLTVAGTGVASRTSVELTQEPHVVKMASMPPMRDRQRPNWRGFSAHTHTESSGANNLRVKCIAKSTYHRPFSITWMKGERCRNTICLPDIELHTTGSIMTGSSIGIIITVNNFKEKKGSFRKIIIFSFLYRESQKT